MAKRNPESAPLGRRVRMQSWMAGVICLGLLAGCVPAPRSWTAHPAPAATPTATATSPADSTQFAPNGELRVAILPLANYTAAHDAADRVAPLLAAEIGAKPGVFVVDAGAVESALALEPWLLLDRVPPDQIERLSQSLHVDALLVGALQAYGYRDAGGDRVPQVSVSLRLLTGSTARVEWTGVHSRDGDDGEWLFGFGRVHSLDQLALRTVHEVLETFPVQVRHERRAEASQQGKVVP